MTDDFYDLLEVPPDAPSEEIREAFREQVRVYHPDLNDDDRARAQFTAVKKAYDILGDPVERKAYDRLGHETYVAKRTSGLPSPDVWATDDADGGSNGAATTGSDERRSRSDATGTTGAGGTTSSGTASGRTASSEVDSGSRRSRSSSSRRSRSSTSGSSSSASSGSHSSSASATGGTAADTGRGRKAGARRGASGGTGRRSSSTTGRESSSTTGTSSAAGTAGGEAAASEAAGTGERSRRSSGARSVVGPLSAWWRRRRLGVWLIWILTGVYAAGLVQFGLHNASALEGVRAELAAVEPTPAAVSALLLEGRHGVDAVPAFLASAEPIEPPLSPLEWYGALAGAVAAVALTAVLARALRGRPLRSRLTTGETIALAVPLLVATALVGGPLLSGIVLLPAVFGVLVRRTRHNPGWTPSYGYVLAVAAPAAGLAANLAGTATLAGDLLAFVVVPLGAAFVLALRATVGPSLSPGVFRR